MQQNLVNWNTTSLSSVMNISNSSSPSLQKGTVGGVEFDLGVIKTELMIGAKQLAAHGLMHSSKWYLPSGIYVT